MSAASRATAPLVGAFIAGLLPVGFTILGLLFPNGFPNGECILLVSAPLLVVAMALPTYFAGLLAAPRGRWVAVFSMLAAGGLSYGVLAMTWMLWGYGASQICRSI